jgi:hypothetical protein
MRRALAALLALTAVLLGGAAAAAQTLTFGAPYIVEGGFLRPFGLAVDGLSGQLFVADTGHREVKTTAIADIDGTYNFEMNVRRMNESIGQLQLPWCDERLPSIRYLIHGKDEMHGPNRCGGTLLLAHRRNTLGYRATDDRRRRRGGRRS